MKCILCGSERVENIFHLKDAPRYAQKLLAEADARAGARVDVSLYQCCECDMVQIDPDNLEHEGYWEDYLNTRACTELYTRYENTLAEDFMRKFGLKGKSVVEIGCGDGYFAEQLQRRGARIVAIEPSQTACRLAEARGVKCYNCFLDDEIETHIGEKFDAFVTKQVIDLVKDPSNLLYNLGKILNPGAYGLIDVPSWSKTLLDRRYYSVLPDRVGYFTAKTLMQILERNHFHVIEVFHGAEDEYVGAYVYYEGCKDGLLREFQSEFDEFSEKFSSLINEYHHAGKSIGAWGAGAKGVTIFSFTGMDPGMIKYVVDKDQNRWNQYMPGSMLKVVSPDTLKRNPVDAVIITAAMFYKEITKELVRDYGYTGDIILLSPMPHVMSREMKDKILAE